MYWLASAASSRSCSAILASANRRWRRRACWRHSCVRGGRSRSRTPPWPSVFDRSRHWCFLTLRPGTDPLKALVAPFLDTWQYGATNPKRVAEQNEWLEVLRDGKATLPDLLDATEKRYRELAQPSPPAFSFISIKARSFMCAVRSRSAAGSRKSLPQVLPAPA